MFNYTAFAKVFEWDVLKKLFFIILINQLNSLMNP